MDESEKKEAAALFSNMRPVPMAWALVGFYLGHFALLERAIDETLTNVVGMGHVPFVALNRNLDLAGRVNVLRTLADMVYLPARRGDVTIEDFEARRKATLDLLKKINRPHMEERNVVAHCLFSQAANPVKGVAFEVIKATNKLTIQSDHWPIKKFIERAHEFEGLELGLKSFAEDAERFGFHKLSRARTIEELYEE